MFIVKTVAAPLQRVNGEENHSTGMPGAAMIGNGAWRWYSSRQDTAQCAALIAPYASFTWLSPA
jgi:hypothetical protein